MRYRPGFILTAPPTPELAHLLAVAQRPLLQGHPPTRLSEAGTVATGPPSYFFHHFTCPATALLSAAFHICPPTP